MCIGSFIEIVIFSQAYLIDVHAYGEQKKEEKTSNKIINFYLFDFRTHTGVTFKFKQIIREARKKENKKANNTHAYYA